MKELQILYMDQALSGNALGDCVAAAFDLQRVVLRDLFRQELNTKSTLAAEIHRYLANGELVPPSVVNELVGKHVSDKHRVLLMGYPRTVGQFESFFNFCLKSEIAVTKLWYFKTENSETLLDDKIHFAKVGMSVSEIEEYKQKRIVSHENFRREMNKLLLCHPKRWITVELAGNELQSCERIVLRIKNAVSYFE